MAWFRKDEPRLVRIDEVMHYRTGPQTQVDTAGTNAPRITSDIGETGTANPGPGGLETWSAQVIDADQQWGSVGATWLVDDHPATVEALADGFDTWGVN